MLLSKFMVGIIYCPFYRYFTSTGSSSSSGGRDWGITVRWREGSVYSPRPRNYDWLSVHRLYWVTESTLSKRENWYGNARGGWSKSGVCMAARLGEAEMVEEDFLVCRSNG